MAEDTCDDESLKKQYEERIAILEKKISDLEGAISGKKSEVSKAAADQGVGRGTGVVDGQGLVENVVSQFIPGLGGIIRALEASSPEFRRKIADTDAEVRHRIDVGWSSKPVVDYHISTRPIRRGPARAALRVESMRMPDRGPVREPIVDVLEGKNDIMVIAELPGVSEEELKINLEQSELHICAGRFSKRIALPRAAKGILEKSYKNGILQVKLSLDT